MPRSWRTETPLPPILSHLEERLRAVEAECNPEHENLHFGVRVRVSPALLQALYDIGLEAWQAVRDHQSWEAAFWFYDWFLLIANICLEIWNAKTQEEYRPRLGTQLALLLVE